MSKKYLKFVNSIDPDSFAVKLRRRRFQVFKNIIAQYKGRPLKILDVGGWERFWETMEFADTQHHITLLNLTSEVCRHSNIKSIEGNGCSMPYFSNNQFDIAFSNSVIEHLGSFQNQIKMAEEIRRVAPYYYIQTPNFWFPLEPHFFFLFFHWLPKTIRIFLVMRFSLGWFPKAETYQQAMEMVGEIRLLRKSELSKLFPDAQILNEKFCGFTKSFIAVKKSERDF